MRLDEAHPAHVGGEIEDVRGTLSGCIARLLLPQIGRDVLDAVVLLVPAAARLEVDRSNAPEPAAPQLGDEMPADEASRTRDEDELGAIHLHEGSHSRQRMRKAQPYVVT